MKLSRYFAGIYAGTVAVILVGLVILVVAASLVESAGELARLEGGWLAALELSTYSAIELGHPLLPIACLLAALTAGALLARRGELLAVQACGVRPYRIWAAILLVVVAAAAGGSACGEYLVPEAVARSENVAAESLQRSDALTRFFVRRTEWFRDGDLLLYLPEVDARSGIFSSPVIYRVQDGLIAQIIRARSLSYEQGGWYLAGAEIVDALKPGVQKQDRLALTLRAKPDDLVDVTGDPRTMPSREVRALIARREKAGFSATAHRLELHNRWAAPMSAVALFLLVAPWALHPDRRRSLAVSLGAGVIVIAALVSAGEIFRLLALARKIAAPWGAWGAGALALGLAPLSWAAYRHYRIRGTLGFGR